MPKHKKPTARFTLGDLDHFIRQQVADMRGEGDGLVPADLVPALLVLDDLCWQAFGEGLTEFLDIEAPLERPPAAELVVPPGLRDEGAAAVA